MTDCQKQVGSSDCGLFAVAVATTLCLSQVPGCVIWDQKLMCQHLLRCFEHETMAPFPGSPCTVELKESLKMKQFITKS